MKRNQPYFGTAETVAGSYTYNTNYKADVLINVLSIYSITARRTALL